MSIDWYADVKEFHEKVIDIDVAPNQITVPHLVDETTRQLRMNLILEEVIETLTAIKNNDLVGVADGIADSIVVLLGTAITYGIDIRPVWDEVHRTNMAKAGGKRRADGKLLKPEGWKPPDIFTVLREQVQKGFENAT